MVKKMSSTPASYCWIPVPKREAVVVNEPQVAGGVVIVIAKMRSESGPPLNCVGPAMLLRLRVAEGQVERVDAAAAVEGRETPASYSSWNRSSPIAAVDDDRPDFRQRDDFDEPTDGHVKTFGICIACTMKLSLTFPGRPVTVSTSVAKFGLDQHVVDGRRHGDGVAVDRVEDCASMSPMSLRSLLAEARPSFIRAKG